MITEYGHAWDPDDASVNLSSGPIRVLNDVIDESVELRPVGFNTIAAALIGGHVQPPARIWVRRQYGWWRWTCSGCTPAKFGGACPTWEQAFTAATRHLVEHGVAR